MELRKKICKKEIIFRLVKYFPLKLKFRIVIDIVM
jgi:hypothetical protein